MTAVLSLERKLQYAMLSETKKTTDRIDCDYIAACTDAISRLDESQSYNLSNAKRTANINEIYRKAESNHSSKIVRVSIAVLAAAILLSVTAIGAVYIIKTITKQDYSYLINVENLAGTFTEKPAECTVPDGYELINEDYNELACIRTYSDGVSELTVDIYASLDGINIYMDDEKTVEYNGRQYDVFASSDGKTGLFFTAGNYAYCITGNETEETLLEIASSVK